MNNASDTKHIRRQVKLAKAIDERNAGVITRIMSDPSGRGWMYDLLESCHVFSSSFSTNSGAMAFAEGERNIGLQLFLGVVQHSQEQYLQMMREAYARRSSDGYVRPDPDSGRYIEQPVDSAGVDAEYDPFAAAD
jgi:hypothetical protein